MYLNMYPVIKDKQQLISYLVTNFNITRNAAVAIISIHHNYLTVNDLIAVK